MPRCEAAAALLRKLGATVDEVSVPMHLLGAGHLAADRGRGRDRFR